MQSDEAICGCMLALDPHARNPVKWPVLTVITVCLIVALTVSLASAQELQPASRVAVIEQEQKAKEATLRPYQSTAGERIAKKVQDLTMDGGRHWHTFLDPAISGSGLTLGAGYERHVSAFNRVDVRGNYSLNGSARVEAEFIAPQLFKRRGRLSLLGGWRKATEVDFYGTGITSSERNETAFSFEQPHVGALLTVRPARKLLALGGGVEWSRWALGSRKAGDAPALDVRYTAAQLRGLGATVGYLHTQATVALDYRTSPGYSRRGGYLAVTGHDYTDSDKEFGFRQLDYEVTQHLPILREAWVISLHGLATTTHGKSGEQIPFFMLPSLGGGSNLRGYGALRFRDRNSLLLQAEWRIMANRYMDTAVFYDAGTVAARTSDLDFSGMRHDAGVGFRFHAPFSTVLRLDLAKSREGLSLVIASSAVF